MRNRLFDSILRTSGADTDDIHSGEAEGNFWAENELFESVLRESHLQETVVVEAGRIYISEIEETKAITNLTDLLKFYKNHIIQKFEFGQWERIITVENTDPPLEIEIPNSCIGHWQSDLKKHNESNKRKFIIAIQGLPYYIQKMRNITPEKNKKDDKRDVDYFYKAECPNVIIENDIHTIKLSIIKRHQKEHCAYSWYINNLSLI